MNATDICPKCGSHETGGEGVEVEEFGATQDCYCMSCNHQWTLRFALVPEPTHIVRRCPWCGGADVQELVVGWENPNTGERADEGLAEMYPDLFWCENCQKHPRYLNEVCQPIDRDTVTNSEKSDAH